MNNTALRAEVFGCNLCRNGEERNAENPIVGNQKTILGGLRKFLEGIRKSF